jgi:hypothetical protein
MRDSLPAFYDDEGDGGWTGDFAFDEETLEDAMVTEDRARKALHDLDAAELEAAEDATRPVRLRSEHFGQLDTGDAEDIAEKAHGSGAEREPLTPRPEPCATCPYRKNVPSGIWAETEYAKLEGYDGSTTEQAVANAVGVFYCHSAPEKVCAGWAAVHGDPESFALRIASARGHDVHAVLAYSTDVPLFGSGHEAAAHGRAGIEEPDEAAKEAVAKVSKAREATGRPVRYS